MVLSGLSLWLVLLLPFVLLSYAIFLAMENRKPTYKAMVPGTIVVAVAGIAALGFCFYYPIKANSAGISVPTSPSGGAAIVNPAAARFAGNYSDPAKGSTLSLNTTPPSSEPGWTSYGYGTMVIHSTQNVNDNIMAGYQITSFQAAGLIDNKNTGVDQVLLFKVMPETNRTRNAWNTNQIFHLRVKVRGNELIILPLNGDESDARRVHHFVRS
jgi:hypothetical protein